MSEQIIGTDKRHAQILREAIDLRTAAMWDMIKALPTTKFESTDKSLEAVAAVGEQAEQLQQLWRSYRIVMGYKEGQ